MTFIESSGALLPLSRRSLWWVRVAASRQPTPRNHPRVAPDKMILFLLLWLRGRVLKESTCEENDSRRCVILQQPDNIAGWKVFFFSLLVVFLFSSPQPIKRLTGSAWQDDSFPVSFFFLFFFLTEPKDLSFWSFLCGKISVHLKAKADEVKRKHQCATVMSHWITQPWGHAVYISYEVMSLSHIIQTHYYDASRAQSGSLKACTLMINTLITLHLTMRAF